MQADEHMRDLFMISKHRNSNNKLTRNSDCPFSDQAGPTCKFLSLKQILNKEKQNSRVGHAKRRNGISSCRITLPLCFHAFNHPNRKKLCPFCDSHREPRRPVFLCSLATHFLPPKNKLICESQNHQSEMELHVISWEESSDFSPNGTSLFQPG